AVHGGYGFKIEAERGQRQRRQHRGCAAGGDDGKVGEAGGGVGGAGGVGNCRTGVEALRHEPQGEIGDECRFAAEEMGATGDVEHQAGGAGAGDQQRVALGPVGGGVEEGAIGGGVGG